LSEVGLIWLENRNVNIDKMCRDIFISEKKREKERERRKRKKEEN